MNIILRIKNCNLLKKAIINTHGLTSTYAHGNNVEEHNSLYGETCKRTICLSSNYRKITPSIQMKWNKKTERFIGKMSKRVSGFDNSTTKRLI